MANQLFHIVITTHSTLCEGYLKATKLILMNDATGISAVPFKENTSPDDFEESMKEIISQHHLQPLIILTDLIGGTPNNCLLYTSPSPRDPKTSRMPSSA